MISGSRENIFSRLYYYEVGVRLRDLFHIMMSCEALVLVVEPAPNLDLGMKSSTPPAVHAGLIHSLGAGARTLSKPESIITTLLKPYYNFIQSSLKLH